jgi:uncharacterized protein
LNHDLYNIEQLETCYGEPSKGALLKEFDYLDLYHSQFIGLSPFLVMASSLPGGPADASPRGGAPGFVKVLDQKTLLLPDRPGNDRVDSLHNVLANPYVGLLFFVPGKNETLRINGVSRITTEQVHLAPLIEGTKVPRSGLLITVQEAYFHCGKALSRAKLWDLASQTGSNSFPAMSKVFADQIAARECAAKRRCNP